MKKLSRTSRSRRPQAGGEEQPPPRQQEAERTHAPRLASRREPSGTGRMLATMVTRTLADRFGRTADDERRLRGFYCEPNEQLAALLEEAYALRERPIGRSPSPPHGVRARAAGEYLARPEPLQRRQVHMIIMIVCQ